MIESIFTFITILYIIEMSALFAILLYRLRKRKEYFIAIILILTCYLSGEILTGLASPPIGTAFYAVGHLILLLYLCQLFNGNTVYYSGIFIFLCALIFFTGYFWPVEYKGFNNSTIIYSGTIVLYISIAIIFALNDIENKWFYSLIFFTLAFWIAGYALYYHFGGVAELSHLFLYGALCKGLLVILISILLIRLARKR